MRMTISMPYRWLLTLGIVIVCVFLPPRVEAFLLFGTTMWVGIDSFRIMKDIPKEKRKEIGGTDSPARDLTFRKKTNLRRSYAAVVVGS